MRTLRVHALHVHLRTLHTRRPPLRCIVPCEIRTRRRSGRSGFFGAGLTRSTAPSSRTGPTPDCSTAECLFLPAGAAAACESAAAARHPCLSSPAGHNRLWVAVRTLEEQPCRSEPKCGAGARARASAKGANSEAFNGRPPRTVAAAGHAAARGWDGADVAAARARRLHAPRLVRPLLLPRHQRWHGQPAKSGVVRVRVGLRLGLGRAGGAAARWPGVLGLARQAPGWAAASERAAGPLRALQGATVRP